MFTLLVFLPRKAYHKIVCTCTGFPLNLLTSDAVNSFELRPFHAGGGSSYRNMDDGNDAYFQPLASGDFGLDEEEARSPASLNGH